MVWVTIRVPHSGSLDADSDGVAMGEVTMLRKGYISISLISKIILRPLNISIRAPSSVSSLLVEV